MAAETFDYTIERDGLPGTDVHIVKNDTYEIEYVRDNLSGITRLTLTPREDAEA